MENLKEILIFIKNHHGIVPKVEIDGMIERALNIIKES